MYADQSVPKPDFSYIVELSLTSSYRTKISSMTLFRIVLIIAVVSISALTAFDDNAIKRDQPVLGSRSVKIIEAAGLKFKDLNKNGKLDGYEDWRLTASQRSKDLVSKMSLEEKAGFLLISDIRM